MANEENLKPFTSDQSREEAKKNGRKGGIASGKARREKKLLKDYLQELLDKKKIKIDGKEVDGATAITLKLIQQAMKGNVKAYTTIRDTLGQAPVQGINLTSEVGDDGLLSALEKGLSEDGDK